MSDSAAIPFYRSPLPIEKLRELTKKSDARGLLHAGSFFFIYLLTTAITLYFFERHLWVAMVLAAYLHSIFFGFLGMGASVHELSHGTAFKTKWLNELFYRLFAFLTWNSYVHFKESHRRHHLCTGFDLLDREIPTEPMEFTKLQVVGWFTFDWVFFRKIVGTNFAHAFGNTDVDFYMWCPLLKKEDIKTKKLISWARFVIVGHLVLLATFIFFKLWILIYTVTVGYFFAQFLVHGCEIQQHAGLQRNVPDWRVVAYTAQFGPLMSFLYWNMNYHTEHHMFAAVPFYNLPKLHKAIEADLPVPIRGYLRGVLHVVRTKRRQKADPNYRFMPVFPDTARPPKLA